MITLSVQYADQDDIVEERGAVDVEQAIEAFRGFPWEEQLAEAKELQICSPSLFLKDSNDGSVFFASILLVDKLVLCNASYLNCLQLELEDHKARKILAVAVRLQPINLWQSAPLAEASGNS